MKSPRFAPSLWSLALIAGSADAASIAINFAENVTNQDFAGGAAIGPTGIESSNWNNSISQAGGDNNNLDTGSLAGLVDDSGAATSAAISWSSANTWYNMEDGTGSDPAKLAVGYLDDGGAGITISLTAIPYSAYRVYVLLSSDQGQSTGATSYTATNSLVINGSNVFGQVINGDDTPANVTAYGSIVDAQAGGGANWVEILGDGAGSQTQTGNYVVFDTTGDLAITSSNSGGRGSIAGLVVEQVPEPSTVTLAGLAGLGLLRRRRR